MDYIAFLRQFRIGPFAVFDTLLSFIGVYMLAPLLTKLFSKIHLSLPRKTWLWLTVPISVVFHIVLGQNTPFIQILMDSNKFEFYISIVALLFMTYMGLRAIKKLKS